MIHGDSKIECRFQFWQSVSYLDHSTQKNEKRLNKNDM